MKRAFNDPYLWLSMALVAVWLTAWAINSPNLYGWLTDDANTFDRILTYEQGGGNLLNIPWFHAYMWFIATIPWLFHWSVPSYSAPRAWQRTGEFRAFIFYTIALHAVLLGMLAYFFRRLCENRVVCFGALVLIATSPTFVLYADLLDSRYLGYLAGLPAMLLLLRRSERLSIYALAGWLLAVSEDIHYECLYLIVPFCVVYWIRILFARRPRMYLQLAMFFVGIAAWVIPLQLISLHYQSFDRSYIGAQFVQFSLHTSPYSWTQDMETWGRVLFAEMGLPMIIAVAAGAWILSAERLRPPYVTHENARLMVWTLVALAGYLVVTPAFPFFRMLSGSQFFMALLAMTAIERTTHAIPRLRSAARYAFGVLLFLAISFVPSVLRAPEVFTAQQGLGEAVNLAYRLAGPGHVWFSTIFYNDTAPHAVSSRTAFKRLTRSDYLVTDDPLFFHAKYPDIFALLYDTKPVASFPTEWCTQEVWNEVGDFFGFRRWYDEPSNCEAQVFRVADILTSERGLPLVISTVKADSQRTSSMGPARVLAIRNARDIPSNDDLLWRYAFRDLWVSSPTPGPHWLEIDFEHPAKIGAITIVPSDFRVPPDSLWSGRKRIDDLRIYGAAPHGRLRLLWSGFHLQNDAILTAMFAPAVVQRVRFVIEQPGQPYNNHAAAIAYIRFLGYRQLFR